MIAEVITIGDELLIGQVVDTNSAWIGTKLNEAGIRVRQITSIQDEQSHILKTLDEASRRADIILITGGLGPTKDDVTKQALCRFFDTHLVFNPEVFEVIEDLFRQRGRTVTQTNRTQAEVPANCRVLINKLGTAPGMWFDKDGVVYVSMPGVPYEMKYLMEAEVIPRLKQRFETPFILHRTLLTQGIGESFLSDKIQDFESALPSNVKLAYLPSPGMVRLRLSARGDEQQVRDVMDKLVDELSGRIRDHLFGYDEDTIQGVLGELLLQRGLRIATAESCTGGYMAHLLTSVPGSSAWYMGSTVTYSYQSKSDILGVPVNLIQKQGAVSEEVVISMAENVKRRFGTDCALSTSGVAGPGGGTPEKPVGTVWIGVVTPTKTFAKKLILGDNRLRTIQMASMSALNMLRKALLE